MPLSYRTLSLRLGSRQIRLFSLEPDHEDFHAPLRGNLSIAEFDDGTDYEALSYTWGLTNAINQSQVRLPYGVLSISYNLDVALRHLRLNEVARILWIDAICIDQSSISEKSGQVAQMREVYEHASEVQIWLGPAGIYSHDGIKVLAALLRPREVPNSSAGLMTTFELHALDDILSRDWWSRLWVVQEAAIAKRANLICGYEVVLWPTDKELESAMSNISRHIEMSPRSAPALLARMQEILQMQLWRAGTGGPSLLELVLSATTRYCSNGLDRIFALRGLASDIEASQNSPDYSISVEAATEHLFSSTILRTNSLDILSCERVPLATSPSWLLSLTSGIDDNRLAFHLSQGFPLCFRQFRASGDFNWYIPVFHETTHPGLLSVRGFNVTNIYSNLTSRPLNSDRRSNIMGSSPLVNWCRLWCALTARPLHTIVKQYEDGYKYLDAVWRTLMADTHMKTLKRPEIEYGNMIIAEIVGGASLLGDAWNLELAVRERLGFEETPEHMSEYYAWVEQVSTNRILIETADGRIGWAPKEAEEGDAIFIVSGATVPFVLRPAEHGRYKLVGACYIHGIMDGEFVSGRYANKHETITLT